MPLKYITFHKLYAVIIDSGQYFRAIEKIEK